MAIHVDSQTFTRNGKTYTRHLLRSSYRNEEGKPRKKTIANISHMSDEEITALKKSLEASREAKKALKASGKTSGKTEKTADIANKNKKKPQEPPEQVFSVKRSEIKTICGPEYGNLYVLVEFAKRIGLYDTLGTCRMALLSLWLVCAAVLGYRSRLSTSRQARQVAVKQILGLGYFDQKDLYEALDWLEENQERIEDEFIARSDCGTQSIFLYDVTSSYLEGQDNELGEYGYNRDGKKGKKQIVVGLLTDVNGEPLTVEVFPGNTSDIATCTKKIEEIKLRFGAKRMVVVGDRGMIKEKHIKQMKAINGNSLDAEERLNYITAITKPQIDTLLKRGSFQMSLFDEHVQEIVIGQARYVLRRNPARAEEIAENRNDKMLKTRLLADKNNTYLKEHRRAKDTAALQKVEARISKLKIDKWLKASLSERVISLETNEEALREISKLDGCYVIKTDILENEILSAEKAHELYKNLAKVEQDFRKMKTSLLENRPIFVRKENRTRAHVFTTMLALKLVRPIERKLEKFKDEIITILFGGKEQKIQAFTIQDVMNQLGKIQLETIQIGSFSFDNVQEPNPTAKRILEILDIDSVASPAACQVVENPRVATMNAGKKSRKP